MSNLQTISQPPRRFVLTTILVSGSLILLFLVLAFGVRASQYQQRATSEAETASRLNHPIIPVPEEVAKFSQAKIPYFQFLSLGYWLFTIVFVACVVLLIVRPNPTRMVLIIALASFLGFQVIGAGWNILLYRPLQSSASPMDVSVAGAEIGGAVQTLLGWLLFVSPLFG
jgi:multisubunit Na+/H+ antiporter MnhC subunit